jgi:hypothetical protein
MLNWLSNLWRRIDMWFRGEKSAPPIYHRSNLHGRHR